MAPGEGNRTSRKFEVFLWVIFAGWVATAFLLGGQQVTVGMLLGFVVMPYLIARERRINGPWAFSLIGTGACLAVALLMSEGEEIPAPAAATGSRAALARSRDSTTGRQYLLMNRSHSNYPQSGSKE